MIVSEAEHVGERTGEGKGWLMRIWGLEPPRAHLGFVAHHLPPLLRGGGGGWRGTSNVSAERVLPPMARA